MTRESSPLLDTKIREAITRDAPLGAAETLWFDVSDRLDATPQRRRRGLMVTMSTGMQFAFAAIDVIAVVGGSVYFLRPNQGVGVPAPSAQPTVTPSATPEPSSAQAEATVPADWTTYTSSRFGYTV